MPLLRWIPVALCLAGLSCPAALLAAGPQPVLTPDWRATSRFKDTVLDEAAYRAIREHYPDDYARINSALDALVSRGAPADEAIATLRAEVQDFVALKSAAASDEAVVRMTRSTVVLLDSLVAMDADACHGMLFGDPKPAIELLARLPLAVLREIQESAAAVITSSRLAPRAAPTEDAIMEDMTEVLTPVFEKYGDNVDRLGAPDPTPEERAVACRLTADTYRAVLTLPLERAGPLLRLMYSEEELETPTED